ncbi:MAG TPA: twin-arginine translocation signal domain-containing protein [Candidatus Udaeobacter sp.]|nr:twin-arginine translocation signal domain-containing protein [Candidatus Udaeobacter sp.]
MKATSNPTADDFGKNENRPSQNGAEQRAKARKSSISRRSFLGTSFALGAGTLGVGLLGGARTAEALRGGLTPGDAALIRFAAAAELIEADFWIQYNELGGVQDDEVPGGTGNEAYTEAIEVLDEDMPIYIHDNTDDEITHHTFLNAYLVAHGAAPVNLDPFRTLQGSTATGVNTDLIGHRLTNLTQLTVDTSWWTRYRDDSHNPDLDPNFAFPQAVPTLGVNQHTAIPRTDADTNDLNFLQAIANTAAFHFATIEQGGNSLYPSMALRATHTEVLRILISIGPTETMHFQTWSDKAGNAPPLTAVDPVTGVSVTFPDLGVDDELFNKSLIMPEPCPFLDRNLPIVSIIRPTNTQGIAMSVVQFLTDMGLFIGQSPAFFALLNQLARDADHARVGFRR